MIGRGRVVADCRAVFRDWTQMGVFLWQVMNLKAKENIARLKKVASKKLGVRAKRVFLASGAEITDVDELQNNDTLYVSQGEAFYKALGKKEAHAAASPSRLMGAERTTHEVVIDANDPMGTQAMPMDRRPSISPCWALAVWAKARSRCASCAITSSRTGIRPSRTPTERPSLWMTACACWRSSIPPAKTYVALPLHTRGAAMEGVMLTDIIVLDTIRTLNRCADSG